MNEIENNWILIIIASTHMYMPASYSIDLFRKKNRVLNNFIQRNYQARESFGYSDR